MSSDKKSVSLLHEIPLSLPETRLDYFKDLKKELGEPIPLDMGRVLTINQIIDDFKGVSPFFFKKKFMHFRIK